VRRGRQDRVGKAERGLARQLGCIGLDQGTLAEVGGSIQLTSLY
jgi:hypothetical protein